MKLSALLEGPARVHVNGKLTVLADLISSNFGEELNAIPFTNRCLIGQFAYVLTARTNISLMQCIEILLKQYIHYPTETRSRMSGKGLTPQELIDIYNGRKITLDKKTYKIKCTFHAFQGVEELADAVEAGHPVIVPYVIGSRFDYGVENHIDGSFHPNDVNGEYQEPKANYYNHSLLAVGVDRESHEVILRDLRNYYLHKGYVKVPFEAMRKQIPLTFTFDVNLIEVTRGN